MVRGAEGDYRRLGMAGTKRAETWLTQASRGHRIGARALERQSENDEMSAVLKEQTRIVPFSDDMTAQILGLARELHADSAGHSDISLDENKLLAQLRISETNENIYLKFAVRDGEVLGGFFGMITTLFFSSERAAKDMVWFVKKSRRGSWAAVLLVRDFEAWAYAKGVRKFFLGQSTGIAIETTRLLYERLGYTVVGYNTVKVV